MIVPIDRRKPQPQSQSEPDNLRPFSFKMVCDAKEIAGADYRLWVDTAFLDSRSIEMAFEDLSDDEVGIDLYIPAVKLDRSQKVPVYENVRLETGRGGLWITPAFVIALYASDAIPGYSFLRLSERTGTWIKVLGEPDAVAARLRLRLAPEAPRGPRAGAPLPRGIAFSAAPHRA